MTQKIQKEKGEVLLYFQPRLVQNFTIKSLLRQVFLRVF